MVNDYIPLIEYNASRFNVSPSLIKAIIQQESNGNANASGASGEIGLMQILPSTGTNLGYTTQQLWDPSTNIEAGTRLIAQLQNKYDNVSDILSAYNSGKPLVSAPSMTHSYVDSVLSKITDTWNSDTTNNTLVSIPNDSNNLSFIDNISIIEIGILFGTGLLIWYFIK